LDGLFASREHVPMLKWEVTSSLYKQ